MIRVVQTAAAMGFGGHHPVNNKLAKRRAARRHVMPGFPWEGKFETKDQVNAYFAGDKIQCLLCGRMLKMISHHVVRIHGMSVDAYKERYGLRWWRGLTSDELRATNSEAAKIRCASRIEQLRETCAQGRETMRNNPPARRKKAPFVIGEATMRAIRMRQRALRVVKLKGDELIWTDAHAEEFLRRVEAGRSTASVGCDADMPGTSWISVYRKTHADYDERLWLAVLVQRRKRRKA